VQQCAAEVQTGDLVDLSSPLAFLVCFMTRLWLFCERIMRWKHCRGVSKVTLNRVSVCAKLFLYCSRLFVVVVPVPVSLTPPGTRTKAKSEKPARREKRVSFFGAVLCFPCVRWRPSKHPMNVTWTQIVAVCSHAVPKHRSWSPRMIFSRRWMQCS